MQYFHHHKLLIYSSLHNDVNEIEITATSEPIHTMLYILFSVCHAQLLTAQFYFFFQSVFSGGQVKY